MKRGQKEMIGMWWSVRDACDKYIVFPLSINVFIGEGDT